MCPSMVYQISCTAVLTLSLSVISVATCDTRYTREPLYGHRCMAGSEAAVSQVDRPRCQWQCLRQNCSYINYNPDSDQCEIGLGQCESLAPTAGVMVNVYWQPRDDCLHWASYQEPGRLAVGEGGRSVPSYAGRTKIGEAMVLGKFLAIPGSLHIWVNNQGSLLAISDGSGNGIEVLTTIAGCPLFWVPYTGGGPLPSGAVVGGYLTDGTATYVARKHHVTDVAVGYYNTEIEMIYFASGEARTSRTMEVLVLI